MPGQLIPDSYNFDKPILCEDMEVDHLIALKLAWESDICGTESKRLANDPRNLRFTAWQTNRAKGMKSAEKFAETLPDTMADRVRRDAEAMRSEYRVLPRSGHRP